MREPMLGRLGERVRELRIKAGLTQEQVADSAGLHVTYIARVEAGARNPSLRSLAALARGLSVPLSKLLEGIE